MRYFFLFTELAARTCSRRCVKESRPSYLPRVRVDPPHVKEQTEEKRFSPSRQRRNRDFQSKARFRMQSATLSFPNQDGELAPLKGLRSGNWDAEWKRGCLAVRTLGRHRPRRKSFPRSPMHELPVGSFPSSPPGVGACRNRCRPMRRERTKEPRNKSP